jgi:pimeloyl-ACP methyl ester carboxylesterase
MVDMSLSHTTVATAVAAGGVTAAAVQMRHRHRIASDPLAAQLLDRRPGHAVSVVSDDGTRLHAEIFGSDGRPTIVLAHGWTEGIRLWTLQIRELVKEFRVVAYDQRGHGRSAEAITNDYSLPRFGEDLEAVLEACVPAGEPATIAGHSLGAMSIASWAAQFDVARRANAVALMNTGVGSLMSDHKIVRFPLIDGAIRHAFGRYVFLGNPAPMLRVSNPVTCAALRYVAFGPDASPATVAFMENMVIECPGRVRAAIGKAMDDMELHHALANISVPALVAAGEVDRLTPVSHAARMASLLPNLTELHVLPQTGHMGPVERPQEFTEMIAGLARSVQSAPVALAA